MKQELLKDSLDVLKSIRAELHGNVENSVINRLDKVIHELEAAQKGKAERVVKALEILLLLGSLLEKLPQFAQVIEHLTFLIKN